MKIARQDWQRLRQGFNQLQNYVKCPICDFDVIFDTQICVKLDKDGVDSEKFRCEICGEFNISGSLYSSEYFKDLNIAQRAALSHISRTNFENNNTPFVFDSYRFTEDSIEKLKAKNRKSQSIDIIVKTGEVFEKTGEKYLLNRFKDFSIFGSVSPLQFDSVLKELGGNGYIFLNATSDGRTEISLTTAGEEIFEKEKLGHISGNYIFIARKFENKELDTLIKDYIKPLIKAEMGLDVFDLSELSQAGVIDNLMRQRIREAKLVLADLSDGNWGAYWEAGYAEGLGKPVVYLCKESVFNEATTRPHFDTNHCTTIMWDLEKTEDLKVKFLPTIQRSILS